MERAAIALRTSHSATGKANGRGILETFLWGNSPAALQGERQQKGPWAGLKPEGQEVRNESQTKFLSKQRNWSSAILEPKTSKHGIWKAHFHLCVYRVLGYWNTHLGTGGSLMSKQCDSSHESFRASLAVHLALTVLLLPFVLWASQRQSGTCF